MTTDRVQNETEVPTLIEVWAAWCSACRAVESDLAAVAESYEGRVALERVDAATDAARTSTLGVMGTPSFVGLRDGVEVFRRTGRASRHEIEAMFQALDDGSNAGLPSHRTERALTIAAGAALVAAAAFIGPSWPLAIIGGSMMLLGSAWWVQQRHGN